MKKPLLLSIAFILTGCDGDLELVKATNLNFHAGDKVVITDKFYSRCYGVITGYVAWKDIKDYTRYHLDAHCGDKTLEVLVTEDLLLPLPATFHRK